MATLIRQERTTPTSYRLNEIAWVLMRIMEKQNPDCYGQDILLYITQCIDENNIDLQKYYRAYKEGKEKRNKTNQY